MVSSWLVYRAFVHELLRTMLVPLQGQANVELFPRGFEEEITISLSSEDMRSSVICLPPSVHVKGGHGFIPMLIAIAREMGVSAYINEGLNRSSWLSVHRFDVSQLWCWRSKKVQLEQDITELQSKAFHLVIADLIRKQLNVPVSLGGNLNT